MPFRLIVEEAERAAYAEVVDPGKLLVLDPAFVAAYETCDRLDGPKGSGPARNFAWETAKAEGAPWHWVIDDNIEAFYRLNKNLKVPLDSGVGFRAMEDFADRYENVAMAGPNYFMFASRKTAMPPLTFNTRIYSCNLIRTDAPFRWRGRFNEDTDLSLRMLKAGWCTVLFNAFLQGKVRTMTMKGGNTDTIYTHGTAAKSQMIANLHPDVARVAWRFGRVHHHVDYRPFRRNKLRLRPDVEIAPGVDNYGMRLRKVG